MCDLELPLSLTNNNTPVSILKTSSSKVSIKKTVRFKKKQERFPKGKYIAVENYEDRMADIAKFDKTKRSAASKVRHLILGGHVTLGNGLPFRYQTHEKKEMLKNCFSVSEVLMWRRLAMHDWISEETILVPETVGVWKKLDHFFKTSILGKKQVGKGSQVRHHVFFADKKNCVEELGLIPRSRDLSACANAVNSCMTCGETPFTETTIRQLCNIPISHEEVISLHLQECCAAIVGELPSYSQN